MGKTVLTKLRSSKGASITFALLAFLVCAVISAVLLASASAAAGRLSGLAESDQRYYAVTSAAQLFCDALEGQEFKIERTRESYSTERQKYISVNGLVAKDGSAVTDLSDDMAGLSNTCTTTILLPASVLPTGTSNPADITASTDINEVMQYGFLAEAAIKFVTDGKMEYEAWDAKPGLSEYQWTMLMEAAKGTDKVQIDVVAEMAKDGSIKLSFSNHGTSGDKYTIEVTLAASVEDNSEYCDSTVSERVYLKEVTSTSYVVVTETKTTKKKTTTISWTVADVKKVTA